MATQLNANTRTAATLRLASSFLTTRVLAGIVVACLVLAFASVIAATYTARRDESAARARYNDIQALVALPPASNDSLQADLASLRQQLADAQAAVGTPTIDPASDALTSLLVRTATEAGLTVKGVSRSEPSQATLAEALYQVQALHITVSGSITQITDFLRTLDEQQPALVASLAALTADNAGVAQADLVFSAYAPAPSPTPPAGIARPQ